MINQTVQWKRDRADRFKQWIHNELWDAEGARAELVRKWRSHIVQWRARVIGDGVTDTPFVGASDVELPLTAMHSDPVYADFMQTLHLPSDFWSVVAKRPDTVDIAGPLQEFLSVVESEDVRMREANERVVLDCVVHGTGIYKDYILHEAVKVFDYNEFGDIEQQDKVTFRPAVEHVPLSDFWIPAYATSIDPDVQRGAPWVAQRFDVRRSELLRRSLGQTPFMPAYDKKAVEIVTQYDHDVQDDEVEVTQRREDEHQPVQDRYIRLFEVWARFDVDGDEIEEDVRIVWHQESRQILLATHNPFAHGKRPFSAIRFQNAMGFYGTGLADMDEWAQIVGSRILNSVVDSAFLSNAVMLGVPYGSSISPDEPIYPSKIWPIAPGERLQEVRMGRPEPAMFTLLNAFDEFAQRRTGVGELRQGSMDGLPSRTPASTVLSILNESNKRFDMVLNGMRQGALREIGIRLVQNLVQISKDTDTYKQRAMMALGQIDSAPITKLLDGPVHRIPSLFGVSVTATSSQVNKEVQKQSQISLMQVLASLYQQEIQYAQLAAQLGGPPEALATSVLSAYNGMRELRKRLIETFDIQNPERFDIVEAQAAAAGPAGPTGPAGAPGAAGSPGLVADPAQNVGLNTPAGASILRELLP